MSSSQSLAGSFIPIIILFVLLYFLMIRPQKKKDNQIKEMRNKLTVGDEIITIGGICGKIVKTKDETIVVQVGADKVKFEMMRWAVSSVTKESNKRGAVDAYEEEETPKKSMPKKLRRSSDVAEAEAKEVEAKAEAEAIIEPAAEEAAVETPAEEVVVEAAQEAAAEAASEE